MNPGRRAGICGVIIVLAAWALLARLGLLPERLLPSPLAVAERGVEMVESLALPRAVWQTLLRVLAGLSSASLLAVPLGIVAGLDRRFRLLLEPTVEACRSLPPSLVILPAMLFLGLGNAMAVFSIAFACAFPLFLAATAAVMGIPPLFLDTARTCGASRARTLLHVVLPASAPGCFSGLKTALPIALVVAVISEMMGTAEGLGTLLLRTRNTFDVPGMYAVIFAASLTGGVLSFSLGRIESAVLVWYAGWKRLAPNGETR